MARRNRITVVEIRAEEVLVGDVINRGGANVYPAEVERVLLESDDVVACAVVGRTHDRLGQVVVAFVVPRYPDDPPSLAELRAHAAQRIAGFKAPRDLVLVESLPRTASGKLRRSNLTGGV